MINFSCSYLYRFGQEKQVTVSSTASDNPNEAVREASYRAYLSPNEQQSKTLNYMLAARDQLSKLVGFNSFAGKLDCLCCSLVYTHNVYVNDRLTRRKVCCTCNVKPQLESRFTLV